MYLDKTSHKCSKLQKLSVGAKFGYAQLVGSCIREGRNGKGAGHER